MRYGIFSDVHSNLEAFEAVLSYYQETERIDRYIFLGDIVGYGASPCQVLELLKNLSPVCVAGNHDLAVIDEFSLGYYNRCAKESLLWTKEKLSAESSAYLRTFPLIYEGDNFVCVHGSLIDPQKFNYILDVDDAYLNLSFLKKQICFIGHSHLEEFFCGEGEKIRHYRRAQVIIEREKKYIVNVGSVGQPRDGDRRACLCVYDSDRRNVVFERIDYDVENSAKKILDAGLPKILANRLYRGY